MLARILTHPRTERFILGLIVFNAITLGLETSDALTAEHGELLHAIDRAVLAVFVVELAARMAAFRLRFFLDPWSWFDLFVVGIALVPATGVLSVLRALRVLRVLRLVTAVPALKRVVGGLVRSLPGMGSIALLLVIVMYVFSVMATKLFGGTNPEQFGSLTASAYTLFQVMTFDDWSSGVVKPLAEKHGYAVAFFLAFIILSTFTALNLFIGVIVKALDEETGEEAPEIMHPPFSEERIMAELAALRAEIRAAQESRLEPS